MLRELHSSVATKVGAIKMECGPDLKQAATGAKWVSGVFVDFVCESWKLFKRHPLGVGIPAVAFAALVVGGVHYRNQQMVELARQQAVHDAAKTTKPGHRPKKGAIKAYVAGAAVKSYMPK